MNTRIKNFIIAAQLALLAVFSFTNAQAQAGLLDPTFNPGLVIERTNFPYLAVERTLVQADGKILIAGYFSAVGKVNSWGVARLNANGSVDTNFRVPQLSYNGGTHYLVKALAVQPDGKVLIGGRFSSIGGAPRVGIARLNTDGSLDTTFNATLGNGAGGFQAYVADIELTPDNKIVATGQFSYNNDTSRNIVRLNSDGTIDNTFAAPAVVSALAIGFAAELLPDGKILVAGGSSGNGGYFIYRLNGNGTVDSTFTTINLTPATNWTAGLNAIEVLPDGKFYVGGGFTQVNGFPMTNLVRFNADGTIDTGFNIGNAGPNWTVNEIERLPNNQIIIGGSFSTYNGASRPNIAKVNPDGSLDNSLNFAGGMQTKDLAVLSDGKILLGAEIGGTSQRALTILNGDGTLAASQVVVGEVGGAYDVFVQPDGKILIGGNFTHIDNGLQPKISRVNSNGTTDNTFTGVSVFNSDVYGIDYRASDGKIMIATNSGAARLHPTGVVDVNMQGSSASWDTKFVPGGGAIFSNSTVRLRRGLESGAFDPTVDVIANASIKKFLIQPDGKYIVVGDFTGLGNPQVTRGRIARVNTNGTIDTTFNPPGGANNSIFDAALQSDGKIIIGGNFTGVNFNTNYKNLARLNADGSLDNTFNPQVEGGVQSIRIQPDGRILIGGGIYLVGGAPRGGIARVNADGTLDPTFNPNGAGANGAVLSIDLQQNGDIIIGGLFTRFNNVDRLGIARLLNAPTPRTQFDFDGDGRADISVFRPSMGNWFIQQSNSGFAAYNFGQTGDLIAPADYDGDGKTDLSVFRNGTWHLLRSTLGVGTFPFGAAGDIPVPADYDGDGKADVAVFRPSNGTWYIQRSQLGFLGVAFGDAADKPAVGDYDGDGKADIAVFRPSTGTWYLQRSQLGFTGMTFGQSGDLIVPADYDGDGKTDLGVYRAGIWYLQRSTLGFTGISFGDAADKPTPADYDGDGKADVAVFRPSNGVWYLLRSTQGFTGTAFGIAEDKPIPNAFVR